MATFKFVRILLLLSIFYFHSTALSAQTQTTFSLPKNVRHPILRYDSYSGELLLADEGAARIVWSAAVPSTLEEADTLVWASVYLGEKLPCLHVLGFSGSVIIAYLDENMLRKAERIGDEILPKEEGSDILLELPNETPLTRLSPSNEQDSFLVAGIEVGKGFTYDLASEKWGSLPFNSGEADSYRVIVSQCMEVASKRYLLFSSDMPGGYGGLDVYAAEVTIVPRKRNRKRSIRIGPPLNLGGDVNSAVDDFDPSYDAKRKKLYYLSTLEIKRDGSLDGVQPTVSLVVHSGIGF